MSEEVPNQAVKPWYVYLVRAANGSLYCGISDDPQRRFLAHQKGQGEQVVKTWRQVETFPEQRRTVERPFLVMDQSACNFHVTDLVRAVECNVKEVDLYGPQDGDKDQRYPVA